MSLIVVVIDPHKTPDGELACESSIPTDGVAGCAGSACRLPPIAFVRTVVRLACAPTTKMTNVMSLSARASLPGHPPKISIEPERFALRPDLAES